MSDEFKAGDMVRSSLLLGQGSRFYVQLARPKRRGALLKAGAGGRLISARSKRQAAFICLDDSKTESYMDTSGSRFRRGIIHRVLVAVL